jgi:hypothetical protein
LETLLSTFLAREVASPCSPTATFLLEEVAWELHSHFIHHKIKWEFEKIIETWTNVLKRGDYKHCTMILFLWKIGARKICKTFIIVFGCHTKNRKYFFCWALSCNWIEPSAAFNLLLILSACQRGGEVLWKTKSVCKFAF